MRELVSEGTDIPAGCAASELPTDGRCGVAMPVRTTVALGAGTTQNAKQGIFLSCPQLYFL